MVRLTVNETIMVRACKKELCVKFYLLLLFSGALFSFVLHHCRHFELQRALLQEAGTVRETTGWQ